MFREYLKLEHDGKKVLMEEWRKIWAEKIHQTGWIEHRKKEKKENQQRQHRHQTHQPQRHQPQHQRHPPQPPQPNTDNSEPQYLTKTETDALHDKGLDVSVYKLKKAAQAVKNWLWRNVGYRATRDQVQQFATICREVNRAASEDTDRFTSVLNATRHNLNGKTPEENMRQLLKNIYSYIKRGEQMRRHAQHVKKGKEAQRAQRNTQINRSKQQKGMPGKGKGKRTGAFMAAADRQHNERFLITQLYRSA